MVQYNMNGLAQCQYQYTIVLYSVAQACVHVLFNMSCRFGDISVDLIVCVDLDVEHQTLVCVRTWIYL